MVVTKKEKVLIFILILILLVGGTYTLGIMPNNSRQKDVKAEKEAVQTDIKNTKAAADKTSPAKLSDMDREIKKLENEIKTYANPGANIYEESLPVTVDGFEDVAQAEKTIKNILGEYHVNVPENVGVNRNESSGCTVFSVKTSYTCGCWDDLYRLLDYVATVPSYTVTELTVENAGGNALSGSLALEVKLLG